MTASKSFLPIVTDAQLAAEPAAGGCCGGGGASGGCGCGDTVAIGGPIGETLAETDRPKLTKAQYFRSLQELRGEEAFTEQFLHREFPAAASEYPEGVSRRRWMQLMGASLSLVSAAAATGCRYPEEEILPFVVRPEGRVPGEPYSRATNFQLAGRVYNLLVSCVDGRPLKIEPNDSHPSGGGTDTFSQASVLSLYDPDRARGYADNVILTQGVGRRGATTWDDFIASTQVLINTAAGEQKGGKVGVLMSPTSSPSLVRMLEAMREKLPACTIARYESVDGDAYREVTNKLFGTAGRSVLMLDEADVVVTLQADILGVDKGMVNAASSFAKRRDPIEGDMNRLYVVEGGYTSTGAAADTRLALRPSQMPAFLAELERRYDALAGGEAHDHTETEAVAFDELAPGDRLERYLDVLAHDLVAAGDKAVIVVGDALGADAVEAGLRFNAKLGSLGGSIKFRPDVDADLEDVVGLEELVAKIDAGDLDTLLVLGDNPVFTAPGDIDLAAAIGKLEHSIYLGEYDDETGAICDYSAPLAHPLESWGDCISDQGFYGVCQPNILPLLGGRSEIEVIAAILGQKEVTGEAIVRKTADQLAGGLADRQWRNLLHDGYHEDLRVDFIEASVSGAGEPVADRPVAPEEADRDDIEIIFAPADGVYDGRFANNAWLQELPMSLTAMCWDNAAVMSPRTARSLGEGIKHGMMVALTVGDDNIELPVYEIPGCAPGVITVQLGYGRTRAGRVGGLVDYDVEVVGTDVSPLRRMEARQIAYGVAARPRYNEYDVATTQNHWAIDELGREETEARSFTLVREGSLKLLEKVPEFAHSLPKAPHVPKVGESGSPWEEPINEIEEDEPLVPQWGMAIDMTKCTGCNACVIACQSENNVPIVGREQVQQSREMHWLRVDRYFQGDEDNADVVQQPVACMHCETAPCEQVCPVAATVHTNEGINAMAYNRCIGTRYCANNCPYKVRRFNYFNYNEEVGVGYGWNAFPDHIEDADRRLEQLVLNPEVTVRGRGVMEKCTYCTQRVEKAKIEARKDNRGIVEDGAVVTACQAACPAKAIEFGNVGDPNSKVSKKHADPRSYGMLEQLNVKPRTEYLARVRNTPMRLMTRQQMVDLATIEPPHHHGHGEGHGHGDDHDHAHGDDHDHGDDH